MVDCSKRPSVHWELTSEDVIVDGNMLRRCPSSYPPTIGGSLIPSYMQRPFNGDPDMEFARRASIQSVVVHRHMSLEYLSRTSVTNPGDLEDIRNLVREDYEEIRSSERSARMARQAQLTTQIVVSNDDIHEPISDDDDDEGIDPQSPQAVEVQNSSEGFDIADDYPRNLLNL